MLREGVSGTLPGNTGQEPREGAGGVAWPPGWALGRAKARKRAPAGREGRREGRSGSPPEGVSQRQLRGKGRGKAGSGIPGRWHRLGQVVFTGTPAGGYGLVPLVEIVEVMFEVHDASCLGGDVAFEGHHGLVVLPAKERRGSAGRCSAGLGLPRLRTWLVAFIAVVSLHISMTNIYCVILFVDRFRRAVMQVKPGVWTGL